MKAGKFFIHLTEFNSEINKRKANQMNKEVIKQNLEVRIKLTVNGMKVKKYVKKMKRITKLLDELDNALQDLDDSESYKSPNK